MLRRIPSYNNGNQNCRDISVSAAWYAKEYYINGAGRNITYSLGALTSSNIRANCASIVYRSYKDGAGFNYKFAYFSQGVKYYYHPNSEIITPLDIFGNRVANGFSAIKKF